MGCGHPCDQAFEPGLQRTGRTTEIEPHEATYLAWINVSALNLPDPVAHFESHGLGLSDGNFFGAPRNAYVRLNFGCPTSTLEAGLKRLVAGVTAAQSHG